MVDNVRGDNNRVSIDHKVEVLETMLERFLVEQREQRKQLQQIQTTLAGLILNDDNRRPEVTRGRTTGFV